jgi:hypothetical protein
MADVKTVLKTQFLRSEPKRLPLTFIDPGDGGGSLQVTAGEKVNAGSKPDIDENAEGIKWVFVEAIDGPQIEKRKGYVSAEYLGPADSVVTGPGSLQPFSEQVDEEDFANTCYLQAVLNETNPAFLYALAFAISGQDWKDDKVQTTDPDGIFRFPTKTWQHLISLPEAIGILPGDIKFPEVQCIVAAILAARSANVLENSITDRGLSAVDLFLAHIFADADEQAFGANAALVVLKADQTQTSDTVIAPIYPDAAVRTAFFNRNVNIFNANGSATIGDALKNCEGRLDSGFDAVRELAEDIEGDVFGNSTDSKSSDPILGSVGDDGSADSLTGIANGIDRRQFLGELKQNPAVIKKSADMVKGEVGWSAPHDTKVVQLETAFNRAMTRGHSLAQALWSTSEAGSRGYYQGGSNGTYSRPVTTAEFDDFKKNILSEILSGSKKSEELLGFVATGNASPPVSTKQFNKGMQGGNLPTALLNHPESYFFEGPFKFPFKRLQGGESISLPMALAPSGQIALGGEPPEQMDGDTEGSGPSGGKFNVPRGTPMSPPADRKTIKLSNGEEVTVNKVVAEQFLGFFNDLIKAGAPVRKLGGINTRPKNASEHPIGYAVDWAQSDRNKVAPAVAKWISKNRDALKNLERRWGLSGGENWNNPDTGHFSIERVLGAQHLTASRNASETA